MINAANGSPVLAGLNRLVDVASDRPISDIKERYLYAAFMTILDLQPHVNDIANAFGVNTKTKIPKDAKALRWSLCGIRALAFEGVRWLTTTDSTGRFTQETLT